MDYPPNLRLVLGCDYWSLSYFSSFIFLSCFTARRILMGKFLALISPALVIGLFIGMYPGYKAYEYMWKDPRFCMTCHQHDYASESWQSSINGRVTTCHDCHHQPLHQYAQEIYILLTQKDIYPKSMKHLPHITRGLCESCHVSQPHDTSSIAGPF